VATNQMRREAAKRKLENQQRRRAERARRRQRVAIITSVSVVVVVVLAVVLLSTVGLPGGDDTAAPSTDAAPTSAAAAGVPESIPTEIAPAPARPTPLPATVSCEYPASDEPAAKPVEPPSGGEVSAQGTVNVTLQTNAGAIPLTLDRALAPCTVHNFESLARQSFYDATPCHRLTTGAGLQVLQCGDPSGLGTGGPGYTIPDEVFPELTYGRGTVAMAKTAAPNSGGSQFFLVYGDAQLPPEYTAFGTISPEGLEVIDQIARRGQDQSNGSTDGRPVEQVTIERAQLG
jgi:peptidyl-prolyl cis-trans isomerase B (cyclophilin B)